MNNSIVPFRIRRPILNGRAIRPKVVFRPGQWAVLAALGLLFVLLGLWIWLHSMTYHAAHYQVLSTVLFINGLADVCLAIAAPRASRGVGWVFAAGLNDILMATLLTFGPTPGFIILHFITGFACLFRSLMATGFSLEVLLANEHHGKPLLGAAVCGLMLSFLLLADPVIGNLTIVFWTGLTIMAIGAFRIALSYFLRRLSDLPGRAETDRRTGTAGKYH